MLTVDDRDKDEEKAGPVEKALIRSVRYIQQVKDFRGLEFGKVRPSDIDCAVTFNQRCCVFVELKFGEADRPTGGQAFMYERICRAMRKGGTPAYTLVAVHSATHDQAIRVAECPVSWIFDEGGWREPRRAVNVRAAIEHYERVTRLASRL